MEQKQLNPIDVNTGIMVTVPMSTWKAMEEGVAKLNNYAQHIKEGQGNVAKFEADLKAKDLRITELEGKLTEYQSDTLNKDEQHTNLENQYAEDISGIKNAVAPYGTLTKAESGWTFQSMDGDEHTIGKSTKSRTTAKGKTEKAATGGGSKKKK